jgi:hypothetical protein
MQLIKRTKEINGPMGMKIVADAHSGPIGNIYIYIYIYIFYFIQEIG